MYLAMANTRTIAMYEKSGVFLGTRQVYSGLASGCYCTQQELGEIDVGRFAKECRAMFFYEHHGHAISGRIIILRLF